MAKASPHKIDKHLKNICKHLFSSTNDLLLIQFQPHSKNATKIVQSYAFLHKYQNILLQIWYIRPFFCTFATKI